MPTSREPSKRLKHTSRAAGSATPDAATRAAAGAPASSAGNSGASSNVALRPISRDIDRAQFRLPCGTELHLLITLDHHGCDSAGALCLDASAIARVLLRAWHQEEVPTTAPE